jgi:chitodextrinase
VSASEIDLAWTAPDANDLIGYRVYRNSILVAEPSGTTYRDSGLQAFTTYNYTVTARDNEGLESDPSRSAQATTLDGTPPTRPENLTATATGTTSIGLSWSGSADPESGVVGYRVYRNGTQVAQTAGTTYVDTGLSPTTTYEYRVSAVNGQGLESPKSNKASATTFDATGPSTPKDLTATAGGTDRIDLGWSSSSDPESGIAAYRIYRDGTQVGQTAQRQYTDTGLNPATEYEYRVSAVNGQGLESGRSDRASATTLDASPPTVPQNLTTSPVGTDRIDLSWTASEDPESGVAEYLVFRDDSQVGTTAQTVFQDDGLTPATVYDYYVVAVNGDGLQSQPSATVSARTFDGTGPTAPTELTATAVATDRIDLTWSPAQDEETGIAAYKVFRDGLEVATTTETSYQDSGLSPATEYEYRVSAVNGDGLQGSLSDPASATTLDGSGPTAPTNVEATTISQTQVDLTWTASEDPETGVEQYKVYRDGAVVGAVVSTSFADTGLQQNTTYVYTISAVNGEGIEGERSQSVSARTFPSEDAIPPAPPTGLRTVTP